LGISGGRRASLHAPEAVGLDDEPVRTTPSTNFDAGRASSAATFVVQSPECGVVRRR